ncbi:MAG: hypothetical protein KKG75_01290 [Nanoarchaeota archaeon]|nr:hypothetical protein [Nanoarchaeota archaeon]
MKHYIPVHPRKILGVTTIVESKPIEKKKVKPKKKEIVKRKVEYKSEEPKKVKK